LQETEDNLVGGHVGTEDQNRVRCCLLTNWVLPGSPSIEGYTAIFTATDAVSLATWVSQLIQNLEVRSSTLSWITSRGETSTRSDTNSRRPGQ